MNKKRENLPGHYEEEILKLIETVRYRARQDTAMQIAERMLDYGIDLQLVGTITGLSRTELLSASEKTNH
ncbi:hypothetical protein [Halalkalibacterium ligniniphilum]|uniref:hypothetical protein n=1 Tax=Halalkalibacterium ligniniphilum TaxID=1134413 RepID=UPI00036E240D|nr:hypothetical protein [Halalkalibacterium ligniniphilum]